MMKLARTIFEVLTFLASNQPASTVLAAAPLNGSSIPDAVCYASQSISLSSKQCWPCQLQPTFTSHIIPVEPLDTNWLILYWLHRVSQCIKIDLVFLPRFSSRRLFGSGFAVCGCVCVRVFMVTSSDTGLQCSTEPVFWRFNGSWWALSLCVLVRLSL